MKLNEGSLLVECLLALIVIAMITTLLVTVNQLDKSKEDLYDQVEQRIYEH